MPFSHITRNVELRFVRVSTKHIVRKPTNGRRRHQELKSSPQTSLSETLTQHVGLWLY